MTSLLEHFRNKFVAGALAAVPVAIVVYAGWWIETNTRAVGAAAGWNVPGLGVLIVLVGVYLLGLLVTSIIGRFVFGLLNAVLKRVPGLGILYQSWKDLLVTPPDQKGLYSKAVIVSVGEGRSQIGFTSDRPLPGDPSSVCVFLPNVPNPFAGELVVMPRSACRPLDMSVEEAFKFQLSSGNYLPPKLVGKPVPPELETKKAT